MLRRPIRDEKATIGDKYDKSVRRLWLGHSRPKAVLTGSCGLLRPSRGALGGRSGGPWALQGDQNITKITWPKKVNFQTPKCRVFRRRGVPLRGPKIVQNGANFVQNGSKLRVLGAMLAQVGLKLGVMKAMLGSNWEVWGASWAILVPYWGLVGHKMATRPQDGRKGGPQGGAVHQMGCRTTRVTEPPVPLLNN